MADFQDETKHFEDRLADCENTNQMVYVLSSALSQFEKEVQDLKSEINLLRQEMGLI